MSTTLKVDSEFESLCPPLTDEEYAQLEDNILGGERRAVKAHMTAVRCLCRYLKMKKF
jgi:hypothetical protein